MVGWKGGGAGARPLPPKKIRHWSQVITGLAHSYKMNIRLLYTLQIRQTIRKVTENRAVAMCKADIHTIEAFIHIINGSRQIKIQIHDMYLYFYLFTT